MTRSSPRRPRREPVNVRGGLVGPDDAERLHVDDDRRTALATMGLGALMLVLAVVVLVQAARLDNRGATVGPATAPWLIGGVMLVVAVLLVVRGRRDMGVWEVSPHTTSQDWTRLGVLLASLVGFAVVLPFAGYVVAATLLFGVTAVVLGAPRRAEAFAYGFSVAAVVWLVFDVLIGIALPAGPWGF